MKDIILNNTIDWLVDKHKDETIRSYINQLPNDEKLNAVLVLVGQSSGYNDFIKTIRKQVYCSEFAERNCELLWDYVYEAEIEVKKHGEVMTPLFLINEMLDKLPLDMWTNPNLKWLDPCNGVGTFIAVIHKRLMEGLKTYIEDDCERSTYILENMLYVCEIQDKNNILFLSIFDTEYDEDNNRLISMNQNMKIYSGSFLDKEFDEHMLNVWGIEKFDIVLGNPPYNKPGTSNSGNTIWPKFVDKTISIISNNGFMCMVHPSLWRRPQHKTWNLLTQFQILHLDIHDTQDGMRVFNAGTRYDWYVLNKTPTHTTTTIRFEDGEILDIDLRGRKFLPNKNILFIDTFVNGENLCKVIHSCSDYEIRKPWMNKTQTETHVYPCVNSILIDGSINWWYSDRNDNGHFNIPKIIISDSTGYLLNDFDGNYGLTSHSLGIVVENRSISILMEKALNSKKFKEVGDSIKWSSFWVDPRFFKYLNKDFYKQFVDENGNEI